MSIAYLASLLLVALPQQGHQVPRHAKAKDSQLAIKVRVDGEQIQFNGIAPVMQGSRVLIPLRGLFERLGAQVDWRADERTVLARGAGKQIELPVGKDVATIDGKPSHLDQPAMIIDGYTYVPLRFLSEALGASVEWMTADRIVEVKRKE